jgi:hypothetical protein
MTRPAEGSGSPNDHPRVTTLHVHQVLPPTLQSIAYQLSISSDRGYARCPESTQNGAQRSSLTKLPKAEFERSSQSAKNGLRTIPVIVANDGCTTTFGRQASTLVD